MTSLRAVTRRAQVQVQSLELHKLCMPLITNTYKPIFWTVEPKIEGLRPFGLAKKLALLNTQPRPEKSVMR